MPSFSPLNVPKSSPGSGYSGGGYSSYYNPKSPQFYAPKEPYSYKPPANPGLPSVQPGNPASTPKPITGSPYPNLKSPIKIPEPPSLSPLKPTTPSGASGIAAAGEAGVAVSAGGLAGGLTVGNLGTLAALLWASNLYQLYKLWNLRQPESKPKEQPFRGGQDAGKYYVISGSVTEVCGSTEDFSDAKEITWTFDKVGAFGATGYGGGPLKGPLTLLSKVGDTYGGLTSRALNFDTGEFKNLTVLSDTKNPPDANPNVPFCKLTSINIVAIPVDSPNEQPEPTPQPKDRTAPPITFNRDPNPTNPPNPNTQPPPPQPNPLPSLEPNPHKPPIKLEIPSDKPFTFNFPGQPSIQINQPSPQPQPRTNPEPTIIRIPRNPPGGQPQPQPQPQPIEIQQPNRQPITFTSPGDSPVTINIPGFQPIIVDPRNSGRPGGTNRSPFEPRIFTPTPLIPNPTRPGTSPTPIPRPQPSPNPQPAPTPNPNPDPQPTPDPSDVLIPAAILAVLTPMLQQLLRNTSPGSIEPLVSSGTCRTTQPGGCMKKLSDDSVDKINQNTNNALEKILNNTSNLANLALLPTINNKLGAQVPGGLSGFLGRLSKSLGIDRALNLIAIASNLHNAMMLSANLKITLLEMLSSVGNATGLLQTSENENVDLNAVFNKGIETFLISILGVESYAGLKVGLRKYNAIYQAATNSLNAVSSMFNSLGNVVEQGAEYTGRIGNALKGAGIVGENAYRWMAEKFDAKSSKFIKFQSTIGDVTQVLETINEIAETVVEGQQAATEFQKANTDFIKAVEDAKKGTPPENKEVQAEAAKAKENATKDPTGELEEGLLSFLTN